MKLTTRQRGVLLCAVLGSAIVFLYQTVVSVALPSIGRQLPRLFVSVLEGRSYVYIGYLLTLSSLLILAGALSDAYGRRRMFGWGLATSGIASLLCGLAPNLELLIVFRVLQGVGPSGHKPTQPAGSRGWRRAYRSTHRRDQDCVN